ncbi:MAG: DUF6443 domain-containing protein [Bacteroidota bacterium]
MLNLSVNGQSISTNCSSMQPIGSMCDVTIPAGLYLSGQPSLPPVDHTSTQDGNITYTFRWQVSPGTYIIKLLSEPDGGAQGGSGELDSYTVTVYNPVGQVSINGPSSSCQPMANDLFTASATNAVNYYWEVSPTTAGTITDGNLTWNSSFLGTATVKAYAYGSSGDFTVATKPVERIAPQVISLTASTGTLTKVGNNYHLKACIGTIVTLSASGGIDYKWYKYNVGCDGANLATIPPDKRFTYCHQKITAADGSTIDGQNSLTFTVGYLPKLLIAGLDNTCQQPFDIYVEMEATPELDVEGIEPEISVRQQGGGSDLFSVKYTGLKYDHTWSLAPVEAGTIVGNGTLTWNASWHSFINGAEQPVVVTLSVRSCSGWKDYTARITVHPILDSKENRIRSYAPQEAFSSHDDVISRIENPTQVQVSAGFFDGLGRTVQNVTYYGGSATKDMISLIRYDEFEREAVKNLPYAASHSLDYRSGAIDEQSGFYATPSTTVVQDNAPFAKTVFDASPLNRVVKQGAPGSAWQPSADPADITDHTIKRKYEVNGATDVLLLKYDDATQSVVLSSVAEERYYAEGKLFANKTYDEHNNEVIEYADKENHIVCKKVQYGLDTTVQPNVKLYAATYYVFDKFGRLVTVLSPEAVAEISQP